MRLLAALILLVIASPAFSQTRKANIKGSVIDENENVVSNASVVILGQTTGIVTTDSGTFQLTVPAQKAFALVVSHTGFRSAQKNFFLSNDETEEVIIKLVREGTMLQGIVVTDERERTENSLVKINPKNALNIAGTTGGVETLIKTLVGSNNELTSQYNVRGGNYDENLVYINDFEIYRPYLVSSGQQEGLSLINAELARNVNFYTGGFQSKYGDKMSSVLDIQYKKPDKFGGTAYVSFLEQGFHLEGSNTKNNLTYLAGVRNKSNANVLSSQPTQGAYIPSATDLQAYITYKLNARIQLELLGIISSSKFTFFPESVKKTSSVFSPLFTANLGLDVYFEGQERDRYQTSILGISLVHTPNQALKLKWMFSRFTDKEKEHFDIASLYFFGDRDFDNNSATYGQIVNPLGAGYYQDYARNSLQIDIWNLSHKGSLERGKHFLHWGTTFELANIKDELNQFQYQDSAGYSLPYTPGFLPVFSTQNNTIDLSVQKYSGYLQDNLHFYNKNNTISVQAGMRFNYNSLNKELLLSPRAQASLKPHWKTDIVFKMAGGVYHQPPFYRELRDYNGIINTSIKAQRSVQAVAGMDINALALGGRPFRITSEAYFKSMTNVIPYDIDNVKIRYLGANNAKAYAAGFEMRVFGELVKDAESWLSIGLMKTKENLDNDTYYLYTNASGEIINVHSSDKIAVDSVSKEMGFVRRPTDRLVTVGLFLQDYLSTNKNFKVHLNMLYGSNMSYNIPNSVRYRNGLVIEPYIRLDMGFSALLLSEKSARRSHSPFRKFENIWLSLEILNIIDRPNTISYQLIRDFEKNIYAIPNRLSPRLVNVKLVTRF